MKQEYFEPGDEVECINNTGNSHQECPLELGKVYKVVARYMDSDLKLEGVTQSWAKTRFRLVRRVKKVRRR